MRSEYEERQRDLDRWDREREMEIQAERAEFHEEDYQPRPSSRYRSQEDWEFGGQDFKEPY